MPKKKKRIIREVTEYKDELGVEWICKYCDMCDGLNSKCPVCKGVGVLTQRKYAPAPAREIQKYVDPPTSVVSDSERARGVVNLQRAINNGVGFTELMRSIPIR